MRNKPFNNHHIKEGNKYYVVNEPIRRLFHIITLTDNYEYSLGILFNACLSNYDIIEYMTYYKIKIKKTAILAINVQLDITDIKKWNLIMFGFSGHFFVSFCSCSFICFFFCSKIRIVK